MIKIISVSYISLILGALYAFFTASISSYNILGVVMFVISIIVTISSVPLGILFRKDKNYYNLFMFLFTLVFSINSLIFTIAAVKFVLEGHILFIFIIILIYISLGGSYHLQRFKRNTVGKQMRSATSFSFCAVSLGLAIGNIINRTLSQKALWLIFVIISAGLAFGLEHACFKFITDFRFNKNKSK